MRAFAVVAVVAVVSVSPVLAQPAPSYDDRPKITVSGEAVVNVKPDRIVVTLGIETSDQEILAAKLKNSDILRKAVAAIKELGVPEKDIQTDHLSIEPRYADDYGREGFLGYFVRNAFVVTLTDTGTVEPLVTKMLQAGVNHIHGVDFQATQFKKYREQARELALRAAMEKAEQMARVLGRTVGSPLQISENPSPWWYYSGWGAWGPRRAGQGMTQNVIQNVQAGSGEISDTIALGTISIRAGVSVTFELKQ